MSVPEISGLTDREVPSYVMEGTVYILLREKLSGWYQVDGNASSLFPQRQVVVHIRNGIYVLKNPNIFPVGEVDLKEWGNIELFDRLNNDMLDRLKLFYNVEDSTCLYVRTMLRASYKGITDHLMADNIWKLMVNYS